MHTITTGLQFPEGPIAMPDGACYVVNNGGFEWRDLGGILVPGNQPAEYSGAGWGIGA